jgi:hypothetical protein
VLTCAHLFLDTAPLDLHGRVCVKVPPGARSQDRVEVVRPTGANFVTTIPDKASGTFLASPPNPNYLQPHFPSEIDWGAEDAAVVLAIGIFQGDEQPSVWSYWAELVTPLETLQLLEESPHTDASGTHPYTQLRDLAVLRIRGRLELTEPSFRGVAMRYRIVRKHEPSPELAGNNSLLPAGRPLGDVGALVEQHKMITAFGWPSPLGEVTLYSDSALLQTRSKGLLASKVLIHDGSSGGATVDHLGHIVAVNSMSHPAPTLPLATDYKSYMRMVSWLLPEHGLELDNTLALEASPLSLQSDGVIGATVSEEC